MYLPDILQELGAWDYRGFWCCISVPKRTKGVSYNDSVVMGETFDYPPSLGICYSSAVLLVSIMQGAEPPNRALTVNFLIMNAS